MACSFRFRRIIQATFACLAVLIINGCESNNSTTSVEQPVVESNPQPVLTGPPLRIGVSRNAPPIIFEQGGETVGLEADFARQLGIELNRPVEFIPMYWPNLIFELREKRIDIIMAGMSITEERKRKVNFTKPYLTVGQKALIRKKDQSKYTSAAAIQTSDLRIGTERASTGEEFVKEDMPGARLFLFPTFSSAIDALLDENIDVVVFDSPSVYWELSKRRNEDNLTTAAGLLTQEELAWAISRQNPELLEQVNHILNKWKDTGWLDKTIDKWVLERD